MAALIKESFSLFIIFMTSFQMSLGDTVARLPSSIQHEKSYEELWDSISDFGVELRGDSSLGDCSPESVPRQSHSQGLEGVSLRESELFGSQLEVRASGVEQDFFNRLGRELESNACSFNSRTEISNALLAQSHDHLALADESCQLERVDGYIDQLIEDAISSDRRDGEISRDFIQRLDEDIDQFFLSARIIKSHVEKYFDDRSVSIESRQELLVYYLESILMPLRDLSVLRKSFDESQSDLNFQEVLLTVPNEIFQNGHVDIIDKVTMGPNPSNDPFFLKIESLNNGRSLVTFNELEIITRDIITLMKAPTRDNYMQSLKWMTLQMMLSQIFIYQSMLGEESHVEIPRSCQQQLAGHVPDEMQFSFNEGQGEEFIDAILSNHGLTYNGENYEYIEYYLENISKDPTEDGYSGLLPFERYRNAQQGLKRGTNLFTPSFDDRTYFDTVLSLKLPQMEEIYQTSTHSRRDSQTRQYVYNDIELLQKIMSMPPEMSVYEVVDGDGFSVTIDPHRQNLSVFLIEVMQREGAFSVDEIISDRLRDKLSSRDVYLELPALYGSAIWRNWGMQTLLEYIEEVLEDEQINREVFFSVDTSCRRAINFKNGSSLVLNQSSNDQLDEICGMGKTPRESLELTRDYLQQFSSSNPYLPAQRIDEAQLENVYPFLAMLWQNFRDEANFEQAKPSELDFLLSQMRASNPWARLRLGYLVAMDEMTAQRDGFTPSYDSTRRGSRISQASRCYYNNIDNIISRLEQAASKMRFNRPISPSQADHVLSRRERQNLWRDYVDQTNEANSQLFTVTSDTGDDYYTHLEEISFRTLLTRERVDQLKADLPFNLQNVDRGHLEETLSSPLARQGSYLLEIYKMRGDVEKQVERFESFATKFGVRSDFSAKLNFLNLNDELKKPFFKSAIRNAAQQRKGDIQNQLDEFCSFQIDDFESFRSMFYMTTKSHNQLNQLAGLPSVPDSVMKKLEGGFLGMTPREQDNMFMALGVMALAIGAIVIGSTCASLTGGLCAPLSVAMIGAGVGAFALQFQLMRSEIDLYRDSLEHERQVQIMEDLGFADLGSSYEVSRTWFWAALEASILLPLVGIVTRSVGLGTRLAIVSSRNLSERSGKIVFQSNAQQAVQQSEVNLARLVLGLHKPASSTGAHSSIRDQVSAQLSQSDVPRHVVGRTLSEYDSLSRQLHRGQLSTSDFFSRVGQLLSPFKRAVTSAASRLGKDFGDVAVRESTSVIDQRTAKVVAEYFGNNPVHLRRLLESYGGKRLDRAIEVQRRLQSGTSRIGEIPVFGRGINWLRNMRTENLAKNAPKLRRLKSELASFQGNNQALESFILRNIDDFTDVFLGIPMRKREAPYLFFWLGAPHLGISRVPLAAELADGMILRKFFTARARLVHESIKSQARQTLGLPYFVNSESTYLAFRSFEKSVAATVEKLGQENAQNLIRQYQQFQQETFVHLKQTLESSRYQSMRIADGRPLSALDESSLKSFLFTPQNLHDRAVAESIWHATPFEQMLGTQTLSEVAHKAARELSGYQNMDEFELFLNALKVLTLKRNHAVVDFF